MNKASQARKASPYFIYDTYVKQASGESAATTVVYCSATPIIPRDVGSALAAHFELATYPQQILLLGTEDLKTELAAARNHPDIQDRIPAITRYYNEPGIVSATINAKGHIELWDEVGETFNTHESRTIFGPGLAKIFREHEGLMNASIGYHYVKPSKKHSDYFLRTANVLKYGNEISFMAAALLSHLPTGEVRHIYTDTASINSLAYALATIIEKLNPLYPPPTINSFGSYTGLGGSFEVIEENESVALISASTSGAIVKEIEKSQRLSPARQIILYFVGDHDKSLNIMCDLTRETNVYGYIDKFNSWSAHACPLCAQGQSTVSVGGDQFLPANPAVSSTMIAAADAPTWLSPFMQSVYGKDIILCHTNAAGSDHPHRTLFLNLSKIVEEPPSDKPGLSNKLAQNIQRHVPAAARWIVHLNDSDSFFLAKKIQSELARLGINLSDDNLINSSKVISGEFTLGDGLALIVASAVVSGRSILSLSRSLRQAHEGHPLTFFVLIARMPDEAEWKELAGNLTYANGNPKEHDLHVVEAIQLPPEPIWTGTPWHQEAELWKQLRDDINPFAAAQDPSVLSDAIGQRLDLLETAPGRGGLTSQLFLDGHVNSKSEPLRLQPNFAFWKFKYAMDSSNGERTPSQADVFFSVSAILHNLRLNRKLKHAALTQDHNWTVISPRNFARYNDAVLQASILRCALPRELDYSSDDTLSRQMRSIIEETLSSTNSIEGAAAGEFLLALALERIRLTSGDTRKLTESYADSSSWPPLHQGLWERIKQSVAHENRGGHRA